MLHLFGGEQHGVLRIGVDQCGVSDVCVHVRAYELERAVVVAVLAEQRCLLYDEEGVVGEEFATSLHYLLVLLTVAQLS